MGYSTESDSGYGFDLGDILTYGYGQGAVWTSTLAEYADPEVFEDFIAKEYPKLQVKSGGDSTIEALIHVVAKAPGQEPDAETLAELQAFSERFNLAMTPVWHEWSVRL
jgi:hypothetical protein